MSREEVLINTADARVRILTLEPGAVAPVHHHTEITDNMFGLRGEVVIRLEDPDELVRLGPGQRCQVAVGRRHQVSNGLKDETSSYLLVQGPGRYDFIREPE